ncbi:annexin domain-containing protein [Ditylenchus destructor]|nr:annexin domain-containing protein [Ditylenchus destructor]
MYQSGGTPTIKPNPNFNANHSAELLRKAMKGFGCDKNKVVQALCVCNNWQRQEVIKQFKVMYGKDLISELKSELSGDFEDLIMALMETPARYDAQQLRKAMAGIGTKESVLIEIMTTRSNAQVQELKYTYKQLYGKNLEHDLVGETSGHFKRLLVSLCAGGRDESWNVDPLRANQDARALYRAGEQRLGTDESTFNAILTSQNFHQLRMVFDEYQKVSNHTIEHAIQAEFSSDVRDGLLAIVKSIRNRAAYFAELIYNSMIGLGTRDTDLIRLIVTRSDIDLADIRNQYQAQYQTSLETAIVGDCRGAYKEGLITLVKTGNYIQSGTTLIIMLRNQPMEILIASDTRASHPIHSTGKFLRTQTNVNKIFHVKLKSWTLRKFLKGLKLVTVAYAGRADNEFLGLWQRGLLYKSTVKQVREYLMDIATNFPAEFFVVAHKEDRLKAWSITKSGEVQCESNTVYVISRADQNAIETIKTLVESEENTEQTKESEKSLQNLDRNTLWGRMFKAMQHAATKHSRTGDYCRCTTITLTEKIEIVKKLHNDDEMLRILEKDFEPQHPSKNNKNTLLSYQPMVANFIDIDTDVEKRWNLKNL